MTFIPATFIGGQLKPISSGDFEPEPRGIEDFLSQLGVDLNQNTGASFGEALGAALQGPQAVQNLSQQVAQRGSNQQAQRVQIARDAANREFQLEQQRQGQAAKAELDRARAKATRDKEDRDRQFQLRKESNEVLKDEIGGFGFITESTFQRVRDIISEGQDTPSSDDEVRQWISDRKVDHLRSQQQAVLTLEQTRENLAISRSRNVREIDKGITEGVVNAFDSGELTNPNEAQRAVLAENKGMTDSQIDELVNRKDAKEKRRITKLDADTDRAEIELTLRELDLRDRPELLQMKRDRLRIAEDSLVLTTNQYDVYKALESSMALSRTLNSASKQLGKTTKEKANVEAQIGEIFRQVKGEGIHFATFDRLDQFKAALNNPLHADHKQAVELSRQRKSTTIGSSSASSKSFTLKQLLDQNDSLQKQLDAIIENTDRVSDAIDNIVTQMGVSPQGVPRVTGGVFGGVSQPTTQDIINGQ